MLQGGPLYVPGVPSLLLASCPCLPFSVFHDTLSSRPFTNGLSDVSWDVQEDGEDALSRGAMDRAMSAFTEAIDLLEEQDSEDEGEEGEEQVIKWTPLADRLPRSTIARVSETQVDRHAEDNMPESRRRA